MHRGYIALYRKLQDHPFYKEKREFSKYEAWIDILWEVQHSEELKDVILGMKILKCGYGESLNSLKTWANMWNWSPSKVKRYFKLLENMNQITIKSETITTRLSVLNYKLYDPKRNGNDSKTKRKRNGSDFDVVTDKNVNNVNNEKKVKKIPPVLEDVKKYCDERKNNINPQTFIDFYQSKNWMIGKNKMKCWKSSVRTWEKRNNNGNQKTGNNENKGSAYKEFGT